MIRFKEYISEMAFIPTDEVETDAVMETIKELGNAPILWRGQTAGRKIGKSVILYSGVVKVTMEAESFKGALDNLASTVIKKLNFKKKPVFCTYKKSQAKFFGAPGAVVPNKPFIMYWNEDIDDLVAGDVKEMSADEAVKNYKKSKDSIVTEHMGEILIDCDSYYWITPSNFFEFAKKSKFNTYKSVDEIVTYADLYKVYKSYKSYLNWRKSQ
jgi:hypothetical protein